MIVCLTESIASLEDKSSESKERNNIIYLDKGIKKYKLKKNKNESLYKNIIHNINESKNIAKPNINNEIQYQSGSYLKLSTSENSKSDYIDKKEIFDSNIAENTIEESAETKRGKIPKKTIYNINNITYINNKEKIKEENIEDNDDDGLIRSANESLTSFKSLDIYKCRENQKIYKQIFYKWIFLGYIFCKK